MYVSDSIENSQVGYFLEYTYSAFEERETSTDAQGTILTSMIPHFGAGHAWLYSLIQKTSEWSFLLLSDSSL